MGTSKAKEICTLCIHKPVCKFMDRFDRLHSGAAELQGQTTDEFEVTVTCKNRHPVGTTFRGSGLTESAQ